MIGLRAIEVHPGDTRALNRMNWVYNIWIILLAIVVGGGTIYYLIAISSVRRFFRIHTLNSDLSDRYPPVSLLKPLSGLEPRLESNLESFFEQDYPVFEILMAVQEAKDPAAELARGMMARYPEVSSQLLVVGESPYANAKVHGLEKMSQTARNELRVITDSDVSVRPDYLKALAKDFEIREVGAVTSLYRGVAGREFWSKLEALGMSTEFMAGVIVAERLEGMKFMLGPSMAIRTDCLNAIGGFSILADYLADDFVLGEKVSNAGFKVSLSPFVIDHHAYSMGFLHSFKHRLRWNRSARFSRPIGYLGQGFTYGLPWALVLFLSDSSHWTAMVAGAVLTLRLSLAWLLGSKGLKDPEVARNLWLVPVQDVLSFLTWVGGFLGREIVWRNRRYRLLEGGRFTRIE
ncbi:MAG TPA: bacteriohopanetetrol glucosamine biosynthesis glycosyltransferase HpnI [Terriglobia bacterium]|nr:bacteriohopanetetrol glucosamine biosynthesis glycosyltransferase HpnI [Terriglobia bacterium]